MYKPTLNQRYKRHLITSHVHFTVNTPKEHGGTNSNPVIKIVLFKQTFTVKRIKGTHKRMY